MTTMTIDPLGVLLVIAVVTILRQRSDRHITLSHDKFWRLVRSQDHPVVLFTAKGFFVKRFWYIFPYQGVLFYTNAQGTEAPDGVTLIGAGH